MQPAGQTGVLPYYVQQQQQQQVALPKIPKVVPNQREKFETDQQFKELSHENEVCFVIFFIFH